MKFIVYSRWEVEKSTAPLEPHAYISITTSAEDQAKLPCTENTLEVLRLSFHDADRIGKDTTEADLFREEHAKKVWDLVGANQGSIETLVLHCDAGFSRSPAVAAAIAKVVNGDDSVFFRQYRPNMRVYRTLLEEFYCD